MITFCDQTSGLEKSLVKYKVFWVDLILVVHDYLSVGLAQCLHPITENRMIRAIEDLSL